MARIIFAVICILPLLASNTRADGASLMLDQAIKAAWLHDPWLKASELTEQALLAESIVEGELPDPMFNLGVANLPTDTLNFDQEPMTQFKVGIAQVFPRGATLALRRRQKAEASAAYPLLRAERKAAVARTVSLLWLDAYLAEQSEALIERHRYLFAQLIDIAHANYAAASGSVGQQDVIRAELELTALDDRLTGLRQQRDVALQALYAWLPAGQAGANLPGELSANIVPLTARPQTPQALLTTLQQHPRMLAIDKKIQTLGTSVDLAKQQYQPEWGVNAAYSYRDDDPFGNERADFISLAVTVDMPIFTANRQDQRLAAATHRRAASQRERDLALRELRAGYQTANKKLLRLQQRLQLYTRQLLPQMRDQANAALAAYTESGGDFAEVMRAHIAELDAKITELALAVERQKLNAQLNYFVAGVAELNQ